MQNISKRLTAKKCERVLGRKTTLSGLCKKESTLSSSCSFPLPSSSNIKIMDPASGLASAPQFFLRLFLDFCWCKLCNGIFLSTFFSCVMPQNVHTKFKSFEKNGSFLVWKLLFFSLRRESSEKLIFSNWNRGFKKLIFSLDWNRGIKKNN